MKNILPVFVATLTACASLHAQDNCKEELARASNAEAAHNLENHGTVLNFDVREGNTIDTFARRGLAASDVSLVSGHDPHFVVGLPAGNSGVGVWFESPSEGIELLSGPAVPANEGALQGVRFEMAAPVRTLVCKDIVLGSIRHVRDYEHDKKKPKMIDESIRIENPGLAVVSRRSLNGKYQFVMRIEGRKGTVVSQDANGHLNISQPNATKPIDVSVTMLTDEPALTPLPVEKLLKPEVLKNSDPKMVSLLAFLSYKEKFLAGSWRYLTYFGRDTLMSVRLLMPALRTEAVEAGLAAIIERLSEDGEVAHEESIGDFASWMRMMNGHGTDDSPIYDYKMVDDNFMLAAIFRDYLDHSGVEKAREFLDRRMPNGSTYREGIKKNLKLVLDQTKAFAAEPTHKNLISLKAGHNEGQWRDSSEGLGNGRYSFDVNVALAPAALDATSKILGSSALGFNEPELARQARDTEKVWTSKAAALFEVHVAPFEAKRRADRYMKSLDLENSAKAPARGVSYYAISLNADGKPVEVMNTDEGFVLLFARPDAEMLSRIADHVIDEFPYGLRSGAGVMISNPAFAPEKTQKMFTKDHYHGTVVWSWQQALLAAGFDQQLKRDDLSAASRKKLELARAQVWDAINKTADWKNAELWTWKNQNGKMVPFPYGQGAGHHTAANADQLWSLVYLGLNAPVSQAQQASHSN